MEVKNIRTQTPFSELFDIDQNVLTAIVENMRGKGFDYGSPIITWAGKDIVIDGHTRLEAAKRVGLEDIPIYQIRFGNESEALAYAIHNQRNRRNLTEAELLRCIEAVDKVKERGGDRKSEEVKSKGSSEPIDRPADQTAAIVGTSATKVKKARKVKKENPEALEEVKEGKKTLNKAYQETVAHGYTVTCTPEPKPKKPKPLKLTLTFKPDPEGGYTVQGKDLKWLISDGDTITECMAQVLSIFEDMGEAEVVKELKG
jgi:hypothetical protein